ncbi:MAG TPA: site-specific integrase [Bryobacteraceae bacterium]|jgi:integrase|nr:site-specific integrase [Bryobacteraceae bacterium]
MPRASLRAERTWPKSTGYRSWDLARNETARWENVGQLRERAPTSEEEYKLVTVNDAVTFFYANTRENGASNERVTSLEHLFTLRLVPFSNEQGLHYIQEMDNAQIWQKFRQSWRNLNPHKNRKPEPRQENLIKALSDSTRSRFTTDLRSFLSYCESCEWLSDNWASRKHKIVAYTKIEPKEPFSEEDLFYIYRAWERVTDGKGYSSKRLGTQNGFEALVFAWTLRYTGLRISDVSALDVSQLVPFKHAGFSHAIWCHPSKTRGKEGNFVNIPIPGKEQMGLGHPNLVAALQSLPLKHGRYFFLGGGPLPTRDTEGWRNRIKKSSTNWRERINRLFHIAEQLMREDGKTFSVHPHPHRFRHTFCASLLQAGVSLRTVASYVGDTEEIVRKHYAKFCMAEQVEAAKSLGNAMAKQVSTFAYAADPLLIASARKER